jgi:glucose-6-phosphate isomerase
MQFETRYVSEFSKQQGIQKLIHAIEEEQQSPLSTSYASVSLPHIPITNELYTHGSEYDFLVIIGIGGSNLGSMAILDALKDTLQVKKKIFFLDTVDSYDISQQIEEIQEYLKK